MFKITLKIVESLDFQKVSKNGSMCRVKKNILLKKYKSAVTLKRRNSFYSRNLFFGLLFNSKINVKNPSARFLKKMLSLPRCNRDLKIRFYSFYLMGIAS